jgi:tetratricopeptide (TPR) repeat protein
MEKIPLRAYNREIEQLIDGDRSEEALEHCQRILEKYPRCLETFRLMGKAYLELHQYDKSEDAFKNVLSFVPDDFISNLGMSLLREKQTNLEGTIWHMERAFEAQSSNTAVQNELRRLYKQRDGVDTPRIRLTRGGLVRMYIKGDMLQQALSEIQSLLTDDPSRMDIRVVQAEALIKANKKDEALQVCQQILSELPYCYVANRLLFENKTPAIKIDEVQIIQQRLRELDPYYEFTSPNQPNPEQVSENEVLIDVPEGLGPKTATILSGHDQLPSSFNAFKEATENQFGSAEKGGWQTDQEMVGSRSDEQKPSWMESLQTPSFQPEQIKGTSSGNLPSTQNTGFNSGKLMTTNDSSSQNDVPAGGNSQFSGHDESNATPNPFLAIPGNSIPAAEPGDIPEWLKALATEPPAASSDAITAPLRVPGETGVLQTGEENLEFLRNLQGEGSPTQQTEQPEDQVAMPSPIETIPGIIAPNPFVNSTENTQPVPLEEGSAPVAPSRDVPEWLRSATEPTHEPSLEQAAEPPADQQMVKDLRQDLIPESPVNIPSNRDSAAIENQYQPPQSEFGEPSKPSDAETINPEIQATLDQVRRDTETKDKPDWLKHENLGSDIAALFEETKAAEPKEAEAEPDWMAQLREENEAHPEPASSTTPISVPNVPDWLFTSEETGGETAPIQSTSPITHQPAPDWLAAARPDIFAQDFQMDKTDEKPAEFSGEPAGESTLDFTTSRDEANIPGTVSGDVTPPVESQPDLSFLDSQPVDFMSADRRPLTDNLVMPEQPFGSRDEMDLSGAATTDNLPTDLAAMLRLESESEFTTNPLEPEMAPEIPMDKISGLTPPSTPSQFQPVEPEIESQKEEASTSEQVFSKSDLISQPEAESPVFEPFSRPIPSAVSSTELFPEPVEPEESVASKQAEGVSAVYEPLTRPVESLPPMDFFVSPPEEPKPVQPEKPLADIPTIEEIIEAVTPKTKEPELAPPVQFEEPVKPAPVVEPKPVVKAPIEGKTIPVSSLPQVEMPPVVAKPAPQPVVVEPPAPPPAPPAPPVTPTPVVQKAVVPPPPPVFVEPVAPPPVAVKPVAPKPVVEKPVAKAQVQEPRVIKPARPVTPKPVRYEEKTIPVLPGIQRKNAGSADLSRAREAVSKGDISTALRRYIRLINSNKALDLVSGDLKELVRKHPKDYLVWQTYGDARLRSNRIQEALDAYAKAADLLK